MYFSKIKSIRKIGKEKTYDLHTPVVNNFFLKNGILTHNSGKSWAILSLCEQIDPKFELRGNFFFKAGEMMDAITKYYEKPNYKKGKIWVLDEAGIDLNNLSFHDAINRGLNAFFQTARHRNYIFFMSVPHKQFISKGVRTLITAHFTAMGWNKNSETIIKPSITEFNGDVGTNGKVYNKCLRVLRNGRKFRCETLFVPKPSDRILAEYEELKKEFTGNLFEKITNQIKVSEGDDMTEVFVTPKQAKVIELLKSGIKRQDAADQLGVSYASLHDVVSQLRKKGFKIHPKKEESGKVIGTLIASEPAKWSVTGEVEI